MKKILSISLLLLSFLISTAQKSKNKNGPPPAPPRNDRKEQRNHNCAKTNNISFDSLRRLFPFSGASKIELISFQPLKDAYGDIVFSHLGVPIKNDTVIYSQIEEVKTMSHAQLDTLTDILYNYGFAGPITVEWQALCFIPRNAIVFLDSKNKVFAYFSICFECSRIEASWKNFEVELCEQKMSMIKELFKKAGIEYGITKGTLKQEQ